MKTRTDLLNFLIQKHGLKSYLEIGLQNVEQNFNKINCKYKSSVDPDKKANAMYQMTSDKFFKSWIYEEKFDIVFIDGLHTAEQVKKDFENALQVLSPNGFIVLHDLLPENYERQIVPIPTPTGSWNGDCWKFGVMLSANEWCFNTVQIDNGCGVYKGNNPPLYRGLMGAFDWETFDKNRKQLLNLVSWDEFVKL